MKRFLTAVCLVAVLALAAPAQVKQAPKPPQAPPLEERVTALEKAVADLKADVLDLKADVLDLKLSQVITSDKKTVEAAPKPKLPAVAAKMEKTEPAPKKVEMRAVQVTQTVCVNGVCMPRTFTQMVPVEVPVAEKTVKGDDFIIPDDQPPDVAPQPQPDGFSGGCTQMTTVGQTRWLGSVRPNGTVVGQPVRNVFRLVFGCCRE